MVVLTPWMSTSARVRVPPPRDCVCVVVVLSSDGVVSSRKLSQQRAIGRSRNRYRQQQCHHQLHSTTRVLASALPLQLYTTYSQCRYCRLPVNRAADLAFSHPIRTIQVLPYSRRSMERVERMKSTILDRHKIPL